MTNFETNKFQVTFNVDWFRKGDTLISGPVKLTVLEAPRRKWYHLLLELITFGWYKAGWSYKVKVIK